MSHISSCPKCQKQILVPDEAGHDAIVRCPHCAAEYHVGESLAMLPPALIVVSKGITAAAPAAEIAVPDLVAEMPDHAMPSVLDEHSGLEIYGEPAKPWAPDEGFGDEVNFDAAPVHTADETFHPVDDEIAAQFGGIEPVGDSPASHSGEEPMFGELGAAVPEAVPTEIGDDPFGEKSPWNEGWNDKGFEPHEEAEAVGLEDAVAEDMSGVDFNSITGRGPADTQGEGSAVAVAPVKRKRPKRKPNLVLRGVGMLLSGLLAVVAVDGISYYKYGTEGDFLHLFFFLKKEKVAVGLPKPVVNTPQNANPAGSPPSAVTNVDNTAAQNPNMATQNTAAVAGGLGSTGATPANVPSSDPAAVPAKPNVASVAKVDASPAKPGENAADPTAPVKSGADDPFSDTGAKPAADTPAPAKPANPKAMAKPNPDELVKADDKPDADPFGSPAKPDDKADPFGGTDTKPGAAVPPEASVMPKAATDKPKVEAKEEPKTDTKPEPAAKAPAASKQDVDPFADPSPAAVPDTPAKSEVKTEVKPEPKLSLDQPDVPQPATKPDAAPSVMPDAKPAIKTEPDTKTEPKVETKPDIVISPTSGPLNPPTFTAADLDQSLTAAPKSFDKLSENSYGNLCKLAEVATFAPSDPNEQKQIETITNQLIASPTDVAKLVDLSKDRMVTHAYLQGGIVVCGTVLKLEMKDGVQWIGIRVEGAAKPNLVMSPKAIDLKANDRIVVFGSMIPDPKKNLVGYTGSQPFVIWAGQVVKP